MVTCLIFDHHNYPVKQAIYTLSVNRLERIRYLLKSLVTGRA